MKMIWNVVIILHMEQTDPLEVDLMMIQTGPVDIFALIKQE